MSLKLCVSCGDLLNGLVYECCDTDGYVGYACCVRENRHAGKGLGLPRRIDLGLGIDKLLTDDQALAAIQSMPGLWLNRVRKCRYLVNDLRYERVKFTKMKQL